MANSPNPILSPPKPETMGPTYALECLDSEPEVVVLGLELTESFHRQPERRAGVGQVK
jgi:hypothetical protein